MSRIPRLFNQFQGWIAGDEDFATLDPVVQSAIDDLIAEEDGLEKGQPTASQVSQGGAPAKRKKRRMGLSYEDYEDEDERLIQKANDEQMFTMGPWYIPNKNDAHDEWTDAEELQKALWGYVRSGDRQIRLQHNKDIVAGEWVEAMSFPVPVSLNMTKGSGDTREVTYPSGTVFLGVKWLPWAWDLVKADKITGFSIGGSAARVEMALPAESTPLGKERIQIVAKRAAEVVPADDANEEVEALKTICRRFLGGEEPIFPKPEIRKVNMVINGVPCVVTPLNKSYPNNVKNVAGIAGADGSRAIVRTDGERFWANGSRCYEDLPFQKSQIIFAEVAKVSFGGNRSRAGQYAAEVRWRNRNVAAAGAGRPKGSMPEPTTEGGKALQSTMGSLSSHCDFDALAADMEGAGLNPRELGVVPEYDMLQKHLTPERRALHREIIDSHFKNPDGSEKTPPEGQPEYIFMGGGPASGKTSMLQSAQEEGLAPKWCGDGTNGRKGTDTHSVAINADEIKGSLPEYGALVGTAGSKGGVGFAGRSGQKAAASLVHEESSILSKQVNREAMAKGVNIILDGTGNNSPKKMAGKVDDAAKAGYKTTGIYATVPTNVAVQRAVDRGRPVGQTYTKPDGTTGKGQGRYVDPSIVVGTHKGVSRVFPEVSKAFDTVKLFDTTGPKPKLIAEGTKGKRLRVRDKVAYDAFLGKADDGF